VVASNHKVTPNEGEAYLHEAWKIIEPYNQKVLDKTKALERVGKKADYKAGNILIYLVYYAQFQRNKIDKSACELDELCSLQCLSKTHMIDYVTVWRELKELFGLEVTCDDCVGVGQMVINSEEQVAFIVGECLNEDV